jgi:hypothetical protein
LIPADFWRFYAVVEEHGSQLDPVPLKLPADPKTFSRPQATDYHKDVDVLNAGDQDWDYQALLRSGSGYGTAKI